MRLKQNVDTAAPARALPRESPETHAEEAAPAVEHETRERRPPLQRPLVRVGLALTLLLSLGVVTLPLTTGSSVNDWLGSANPRAAYSAGNLRYAQASALTQLGLSERALGVIASLPAESQGREDLLTDLFAKTVDASAPSLAVRAIQASSTGMRAGRVQQLAVRIRERGGIEGAIAQVQTPTLAPVRDELIQALIVGLQGTALSDGAQGERLLAQMSPGPLRNQSRETLFSLLMSARQMDRAWALLDATTVPAERLPLLLRLCQSALDTDSWPRTRAAFLEATRIVTPEKQRELDGAAAYIASLALGQRDTGAAVAALDAIHDTASRTLAASRLAGQLRGDEPTGLIGRVLTIQAEARRSNPNDGTHDGTLSLLISHARERGDRAAAHRWAEKLLDTRMRQQWLKDLAR